MKDLVNLTKRDCAREEIHGAIRLLAWDGNYVSANVLASSAIDILNGVANKSGKLTLHHHFEITIKEEFRKKVRKIMKAPYNYMKHADRDSDQHLTDFNTERALWNIFVACYDYFIIYEIQSYAMKAYISWHGFLNPGIMDEKYLEKTPWKLSGMSPSGSTTENIKILKDLLEFFFDDPESLRRVAGVENSSRFDWGKHSLIT